VSHGPSIAISSHSGWVWPSPGVVRRPARRGGPGRLVYAARSARRLVVRLRRTGRGARAGRAGSAGRGEGRGRRGAEGGSAEGRGARGAADDVERRLDAAAGLRRAERARAARRLPAAGGEGGGRAASGDRRGLRRGLVQARALRLRVRAQRHARREQPRGARAHAEPRRPPALPVRAQPLARHAPLQDAADPRRDGEVRAVPGHHAGGRARAAPRRAERPGRLEAQAPPRSGARREERARRKGGRGRRVDGGAPLRRGLLAGGARGGGGGAGLRPQQALVGPRRQGGEARGVARRPAERGRRRARQAHGQGLLPLGRAHLHARVAHLPQDAERAHRARRPHGHGQGALALGPGDRRGARGPRGRVRARERGLEVRGRRRQEGGASERVAGTLRPRLSDGRDADGGRQGLPRDDRRLLGAGRRRGVHAAGAAAVRPRAGREVGRRQPGAPDAGRLRGHPSGLRDAGEHRAQGRRQRARSQDADGHLARAREAHRGDDGRRRRGRGRPALLDRGRALHHVLLRVVRAARRLLARQLRPPAEPRLRQPRAPRRQAHLSLVRPAGAGRLAQRAGDGRPPGLAGGGARVTRLTRPHGRRRGRARGGSPRGCTRRAARRSSARRRRRDRRGPGRRRWPGRGRFRSRRRS
jgi:hypothetical protein